MDYQGMRPIGRHFASYVQQFLEEDVYVQMTGETLQRYQRQYGQTIQSNNNRVAISPLDLLVNYDLKTTANTVPGSQDPNLWMQLMQTAANLQNPEILSSLDFTGIFLHIARQMGASNIDDFMRQAPPTVMPDDEVESEVDRGNLVAV